MKTLPVGELKTHFSEALDEVRQGKTIGVTFGRAGHLVAVLAPPELLLEKVGVKLGLLRNKASFRMKPAFQMTEEEFLNS